ncbi:MAG: hypothetical protein FJ086_15955 [Deltaproteobacteria bacterium]|nr:hypothetical protein [Deltaproteobacteria bacterium]
MDLSDVRHGNPHLYWLEVERWLTAENLANVEGAIPAGAPETLPSIQHSSSLGETLGALAEHPALRVLDGEGIFLGVVTAWVIPGRVVRRFLTFLLQTFEENLAGVLVDVRRGATDRLTDLAPRRRTAFERAVREARFPDEVPHAVDLLDLEALVHACSQEPRVLAEFGNTPSGLLEGAEAIWDIQRWAFPMAGDVERWTPARIRCLSRSFRDFLRLGGLVAKGRILFAVTAAQR